jgi:hypothetical protein
MVQGRGVSAGTFTGTQEIKHPELSTLANRRRNVFPDGSDARADADLRAGVDEAAQKRAGDL